MNRTLPIVSVLVLIAIAIAPLVQMGSAEDLEESPDIIWTIVNSYDIELQIMPGEEEVMIIDPQDGVVLSPQTHLGLPRECFAALEIVPDWIREDLQLKFRVLPGDLARELAIIILNAQDNRTLDEIAFVVAHLSVQTIRNEYFFPEIIEHNAELVYAHDELVPYAKIVERENYTTIVYQTEEGELELPRDIYYWYVVHPDIGDELPTYVDPDYNYNEEGSRDRDAGVPPPDGKFWRDWFFVNNKTGQPLLPDLLNDTVTFMDGIRTVNQWISRSMTFTSDNERPNQPVRIYEKGIGRCGEYQDMRSSAGRAALLPIVPTSNSAEDHVWNEFWLGRWVHWDGTYDRPHIYESGWGKTLSTVWNQRGDGYTWDVTDTYTETSTIEVDVVDLNGDRVDGAQVEIITEMFYVEELKTTTNFGTTDHTGKLSFMVGDERNYWGSADGGDLGKDPLTPNLAPKEIQMNTSVGEEYEVTFRLPQAAERPLIQEPISGEPTSGDLRVEYEFNVDHEVTRGRNSFTGDTFEDRHAGGDISFFFTDGQNSQSYNLGGVFQGSDYMERVENGSGETFIVGDEWHYLHFYNKYSQKTVKTVNVTITIWGIGISSYIEDIEDTEVGDYLPIDAYAFSREPLTQAMMMIEGLTDWSSMVIRPIDDGWSSLIWLTETNGFEPGTYNVWSMVSNENLTHYEKINLTLIDTKGPEVKISDVPSGPYKENELLTIGGSVSDGHRVDTLLYIIDDDSSTASDMPIQDDGKWTLTLELDRIGYGDHTISVRAKDPSGNIGSDELTINIVEGESPYIRLDSPNSGLLVKRGSTITFEGKATDNIEIEKLELFVDGRLKEDMFASLSRDGTFSHDWNTGSTSHGIHEIEIIARDPSGNEHGSTIEIELDGMAPDLEVYAAGTGLIGPNMPMTITGVSDDPNGVSLLEYSIDGRDWEDITTELSGGDLEFDLILDARIEEGDIEVLVRSTDSVGNIAEVELDLFFDPNGPDIDMEELPVLVIQGDEFDLEGYVDDPSELKEIIISADGIGEIETYLGDDAQEIDISVSSEFMRVGDVAITVTAMDSLENTNIWTGAIRVVTLATDTDGDGIPDWWEFKYDLDMNDPLDADADPDNDGYTNLREYLGNDGQAGNNDDTDPNDNFSFPTGDIESFFAKLGMGLLLIMIFGVLLFSGLVVIILTKVLKKG